MSLACAHFCSCASSVKEEGGELAPVFVVLEVSVKLVSPRGYPNKWRLMFFREPRLSAKT